MAAAADDPIVIDSGDESDNDDVVLIKEEIEVDSDDVIFLSEDKPTPQTSTPTSHLLDNLTNDCDTGVLTRSSSLTTCTNQLSLDDSDSNDSSKSNKPTSDNTSPLDLSAKPTNLSGVCDSTSSPNGPSDSFLSFLHNDKWGKDANRQSDNSTFNEIQETEKAVKDLLFAIDSSPNTPTSTVPTMCGDGGFMLGLNSSAQNVTQNVSSQSSVINNAGVSVPSVQTVQPISDNDSNTSSSNTVCKPTDSLTDNKVSNCNQSDTTQMSFSTQTATSDPAQSTTFPSTDQSDLLTMTQIMSTLQQQTAPSVSTGATSVQPSLSINSLLQQPSHDLLPAPKQQSMPNTAANNTQSLTALSQTQSDQQIGQQSTVGSQSQANTTNTPPPPIKRSLSASYGLTFAGGNSVMQRNPTYSRSLSTSGSVNNILQYHSDNQRMSGISTVHDPLSLLSNYPSSSLPSDVGNCRSPSPSFSHNLPPKKQRRCYSNASRNIECTKCQANITGKKRSNCPNGHSSCIPCLEDRVKLVLTGKAKESVKCLNPTCDSYYPINELSQNLPSMVVEILEEKLDHDYINYISDMIVRTATEEIEEEMESLEQERYMKKYDDCPSNWDAMDEREVNKEGYVLVPLQESSSEYEEVVMQFFKSMVDHSVEVTAVYRVQNPILWKYYSVKKTEMIRDREGFEKVTEGKLFHGTGSHSVVHICKRGFDWRVSGKHGTVYGQGSYFAMDASYSHQYTDLRRPHGSGALYRSSMMTPIQMAIMTQSLLFPPVNVNFGQLGMPGQHSMPSACTIPAPPLSSQFHPVNLSHTTPGSTQSPTTSNPPGAQSSQGSNVNNNSLFQPQGSSNISGQSNTSNSKPVQNANNLWSPGTQQPKPAHAKNTQSIGQLPGTSINPVCHHVHCKLNKCYQRPRLLPKPVAIKNISGLASTALGTNMEVNPEPERRKAKMFLARVLVGKYMQGQAKFRKPPPIHPDDPNSKFYDSCVDNVDRPKIFVIFDSAQAYPEYMIEYANGISDF